MRPGSSGHQFVQLLFEDEIVPLGGLDINDLWELREDILRPCPACDGAGRQVRITQIEDGELEGFTAVTFRGCPLCFETGCLPHLCRN